MQGSHRSTSRTRASGRAGEESRRDHPVVLGQYGERLSGVGRAPARKGERGIALLMVVVCLAILMPFTATFNYQARVDWQSAVNAGDEVKARAALTGARRLSRLLFELQRQVFNQKQFRDFMGTMDITQVAPYLMSVFGSTDGAEGIGALVGLDTSPLSELSIGDGAGFEVRLVAESGKLNVNCIAVAADGKNFARSRTVETLEMLMQSPLYDPLFDEEKADGKRYTRQDTLTAMVDYIDDDNRRFDLARLTRSSMPERYEYEELYDPYQARNARLDSLQELHLVEGIDDDWMSAFAHELTIYGGCKVNLNFASAEQIALVIRHAVSAADKWKTEGENFLLMTMPLANYIVASREFNLFEKVDDFKKIVMEPDQFANPLAMFGGEDDAIQDDPNLPKIPDGIEVRINSGVNKETGDEWGGIKDVASVEPERVYRYEATAQVGAVRKRQTGVYDMQYQRSQSSGKGAWLYMREE
jgi:general secretion pathway protein K